METPRVRRSHGVILRTQLSASHRGDQPATGSVSSHSPMTVWRMKVLNCILIPYFHSPGVVYNECTTAGLGQAWCSVSTWPNGTHRAGQGLYGLCPATCPGAGGTCRPGSTWQVECNTCTCSLLSTPVCTLEDCSAKPKCTPGHLCIGRYFNSFCFN